MAIAITVNEYLSKHDVNYELVEHRHTRSSLDSSCSARIPTEQVAKAVILENDDGEYLMASLPVDHRLALNQVNELTGKVYFLINEVRLRALFPDCAQGAIPCLGEAYAIKMIIDDSLLNVEQVYIEAGDHRHLVKLDHQQYSELFSAIPHGSICGAVIGSPKQTEHLNGECRI